MVRIDYDVDKLRCEMMPGILIIENGNEQAEMEQTGKTEEGNFGGFKKAPAAKPPSDWPRQMLICLRWGGDKAGKRQQLLRASFMVQIALRLSLAGICR